MKPTIRLALITSLLASLLLLSTTSASACSCAGGLPFIYFVTNADAIFSGKVVAQEASATPTPYGGYPLFSTIAVAKIWKGHTQPTITVEESRNSTCIFGLELNKEYLLFATILNGDLHVDVCGRNQPLATAERDIALLDQLFSDLSVSLLHPSATVTVLGTTAYTTQVDQLSLRFMMAEAIADKSEADTGAELEEQQMLLHDLLQSAQMPTSLLDPYLLSTDGRNFYLTVKRSPFTDDELLSLLDQLTQFETTVAKDNRLPLRAIEVMFSVEDCTLPLVEAHRNAMWNARYRAGLLATTMYSAVDTVQTVVEEYSNSLPPDGRDACQALEQRPWYKLPLTTDLPMLLTLDVPIQVRVTFGLKPAITQELPAATAPFVSPLPKPTR